MIFYCYKMHIIIEFFREEKYYGKIVVIAEMCKE